MDSNDNQFLKTKNITAPPCLSKEAPILQAVEFKDKFYKITETADIVGVSTSLLRFWEKELKLIQPKRDGAKRIRLYESRHIELFKLIKKLIREDGYTLKGVQQYIHNQKNRKAPKKLISELKEIRSFFEAYIHYE